MKKVLITGCSSGFGLELVQLYLREGWFVIATMRNLESRRMLLADMESKFPDRLKILELDITDKIHRERLKREITEIDCLINNAGFGLFGAFEDLSEVQIREQMDVNFFGTVLLTQELLPILRQSKGKIIIVSSGLGFMGMPMASLYAATKFALEGWAESLWYELRPFRVQVCLVEPGQFRTGFSQKLKYGEHSQDPFSPYFRQTKALKAWREERKLSAGVAPMEVVEKIVKLSDANSIPLRVRCGKDAKMGFALRWLLPQMFYHPLLASLFSFRLKMASEILEAEEEDELL